MNTPFRAVLLAVLTFLALPLQAQNVDPPSLDFSDTYSGRFSDTVRNSPQRYVIGYNWGRFSADSTVSKQLRVNTIHLQTWLNNNYRNILRSWVPSGTRLLASNNVVSAGSSLEYALGLSMEFDPTITQEASHSAFTPRYKDTSGAVWGFTTQRVGAILQISDTNNPNYNRFILQHSDLQSAPHNGQPTIVLENTSPNNQLYTDEWPSNMLKEIRKTWPNWGDLYVRDVRRYKSGIYVQKPGGGFEALPHYADTTLRGSDTTLFHIKGDGTSEWWFAINLRRLNNVDYGANDTVLSIRIPYRHRLTTIAKVDYYGGWQYARFDSVAVPGDTIEHPRYGLMDKSLGVNSGPDTVFYITRNMLPLSNTLPVPDITLSAYFTLPPFYQQDRYDFEVETPHGILSGPPAGSTWQTDELGFPVLSTPPFSLYPPAAIVTGDTVKKQGTYNVDIEVTYYGGADIAIDWTRIENRSARLLLRGTKDSIIRDHVGKVYTFLDTAVGTDHRLSILRHYGYDENTPAYRRVQRYLNRLLENAVTTETGWYYRGQYEHQAEVNDHWFAWTVISPLVGAPYIQYGDGGNHSVAPSGLESFVSAPYRTMNLKRGYLGATVFKEQGGSIVRDFWKLNGKSYETAVTDASTYGYPNIYEAPDSIYYKCLSDVSLQGFLELGIMRELKTFDRLLYSKQPLWFNPWTLSQWVCSKDTYLSGYDSVVAWDWARPMTGEESRLSNWFGVVLGFKGILHYLGESNFGIKADGPRGQNGLVRTPTADTSTGRRWPVGMINPPLGGDFLDSLDILNSFIDPLRNDLAYYMGIPTNRFYVGTASLFKEVKKLNELLDDNSAELMRLRLMAYYNKGYKLIQSTRDSAVNIHDFVTIPYAPGEVGYDTAQANIVRSIHTRTGAPCPNCYDNWRDSTFLVLTLLADSTKSMDEQWYLGMLNRRTDPTISYPTAGGTLVDTTNSIKFFSTVEFDSLAAAGHLDSLYTEPAYAQYGAREIRLQLKLGQVLSDSMFSLIRITDMAGTYDTVFAEDQLPPNGLYTLSLKFKPGEGKLIRVRILHPGTVLKGELAYSNQRKMVCVPEPNDSTKVRYYMVYHRRDNARYEVFYRYSKPTSRNDDGANIVWEAEEPLSMIIRKRLPDGKFENYENLNCAYPSLVIRPAEWGQQRVYVVFGCEHPDDKVQQQWIVENNFTPIPLPYPMPLPRSAGDIIATTSGRSLADWGTPVVSAVDQGNIYAWADSVQGIVLGFKPAIVDTLTATLPVRWSLSSDSVQHPSLATYTRYELGENSTALVWQEDEEIYYAQPYVDTAGTLGLHQLPVYYDGGYQGGISWLPPNEEHTIVAMCDPGCTRKNRMPVVYRGIDPNSYSGAVLTLDRVAWEGRSSGGSDTYLIFSRWIDLETDTTTPDWLPVGFYRSGMNQVFSPLYSFHQADLAQGAQGANAAWWLSPSATVNGSDSAFVMSFISWYWAGGSPFTNTKVWHLPLSYRASRQGDRIHFANIQQNHVIAQNGLHPHLAARPAIEPGTWWQNRRVFEFGTKPDILSSAQYYYRTITERSDYALTKVPTFSKACNSLGIFDLWYKTTPVSMEPKTGGGVKPIDTLVSDSFAMSGPIEISFFLTGSDTSLAQVELVNENTSARSVIPLVPASSSTATLVSVTYTNGGGDMYHVEFIKKLPAEYTTNYLAGPMPLADSSGAIIGFAKASQTERTPGRVVNLAVAGTEDAPGLHAYVYPNPSQDKIAISPYRTFEEDLPVAGDRRDEHLIVRVVSMLGAEVARFDTRAGVSVELSVQHLPKGVYFVRVEQAGNPQESGMTSFIVE